MKTSELLAGLKSRAKELKAELSGIEAAIAGLENKVPEKQGRVYAREFDCVCIQCGETFKGARSTQKFCITKKPACANVWWQDERSGKHVDTPPPTENKPAKPIPPRQRPTVLVQGAKR